MRAQAGEIGAERPAGCLRQQQVRVAHVDHRGSRREGRCQLRPHAAEHQVGDQGGHVRLVVRADPVGLVAGQVLVGIEHADHPVDLVGGAGQAQFLAEGFEPRQRLVGIGVAVQHVGGAEVIVQAVDRLPVALGGDRGQHRTAQPRGLPVDLGRNALVLDVLFGAAVGVGHPRERIGLGRERRRTHRQRLAPGDAIEHHRTGADDRLHRRAAVLLAAGVVGRDLDLQGLGRLQQQLAAQGVVVLVVVVGLAARAIAGAHVHPAVARTLGPIDAEGRLVAQVVVVASTHAQCTVVAHGQLALGALGVTGLAGDHVDHAGRGVLAEYRALRALEHFDALELAQVAEADAVARAVHPIDHHAHRRLQADVVADRADAADARGGDRVVLGAGDGQARHQDLQVLDVAHAGVLQQLLVEHGDGDRHVLQRLLALLRGDGQARQGRGFLFLRRCRLLRVRRRGGKAGQCGDDGDRQSSVLQGSTSHDASPKMCDGDTRRVVVLLPRPAGPWTRFPFETVSTPER